MALEILERFMYVLTIVMTSLLADLYMLNYSVTLINYVYIQS